MVESHHYRSYMVDSHHLGKLATSNQLCHVTKWTKVTTSLLTWQHTPTKLNTLHDNPLMRTHGRPSCACLCLLAHAPVCKALCCLCVLQPAHSLCLCAHRAPTIGISRAHARCLVCLLKAHHHPLCACSHARLGKAMAKDVRQLPALCRWH